jgi:hypothetical protein
MFYRKKTPSVDMIIKEFRIPMPMTLEEYHRGQVYSVAETSKRETGGGDGIEMIKSEQFQDGLLPSNAPTGLKLDSGQYTLKKQDQVGLNGHHLIHLWVLQMQTINQEILWIKELQKNLMKNLLLLPNQLQQQQQLARK